MKKPDTGMVVSAVAHAAVLTYAIIGFNYAQPFDAAPEALAVEVMTSAEYDKLTKGDKTAKKVEEKPKVAAKKVAAVTPEPKPPAPEAKENVEAPPPPPEPEKVEAPEPKPEPKKPDPPKQAETPPPVPAPKPADLPKPKPPEKKVEEKQQAKLDKLIEKQLEKKPEPKKAEKRPDKPKPEFDPTKIAALIDKRDPGRTPQEAPEISNITTAGISNGPVGQLELSEISRINAMVIEQVRQCWSPPIGAQGSSDLAVIVQFSLAQDGSLTGEPRVMNSSGNPYFQSAVDSALRAVRRCSPLNLPVQYYDHWKFVEINFDPRQMMGG